jgi:hypothetical protein
MIDWALTEERFGKVRLTTFRPKVIMRCDSCGKESIFTIRIKSRIKDNQINWLCYKCATNKPQVKEIHSQQMLEQWKDNCYKDERKNSSKKLWEDKTYTKKISESEIKHYQNPSIRQKLSDYYKEKYSDASYREKRRQFSIELWKKPDFREKVAAGTGKSIVLTGNGSSNLHKVFKSILDELLIPYEEEYQVGPYLFDFKLNFKKPMLVEIQGDYWHHLSQSIERDKRKATYIGLFSESYDFKVLWEYEFYTKDRVKNKLLLWSGKVKLPKQVDFTFKDLVIKEVDAKSARIFLSHYHYTCNLGRGGFILGAFLRNKLIATIIFSHVIRKEVADKQKLKTSQITEISRFAIADQYQKKNFGSWFIRKAIPKLPNEIKMIISFSDMTFGHEGIIYKASGFKLDGEVRPTYWYVDKNGWVMHKKTLYEHARSLRMNESEFAEKYLYRKTYGSYKLRYILCR